MECAFPVQIFGRYLTLILIVTAFVIFCGGMIDVLHEGGTVVLKRVISTNKEVS
jgi:non-ribosomal peptide synthetase component E (peptide arylation enzyme)